MKTRLLNVTVGAIMLASVAQAIPSFNTVTWNAVTVGGVDYQDGHFDPPSTDPNTSTTPSPGKMDIVGNAANPAAYYAYDGQFMYFRMRVDNDPMAGGAINNVWQAVLNTGGDNTADWVIQLDLTSDNQVELAKATAGSPTVSNWGTLAYNSGPHTPPTGFLPTNWYQFSSTGDTTTFPDSPVSSDYYVDFAFDKATFDATLITAGETAVDNFQVVFATSTQHINSNKDLPDVGWSDPITVPEPTSMALLALGVTVLAMRRRKI